MKNQLEPVMLQRWEENRLHANGFSGSGERMRYFINILAIGVGLPLYGRGEAGKNFLF